MLPHTGLSANISDLNTISTTLTGPPVLVEIIRMDDVSTSAFQLDQIRQAREERIRAGVGNEEGKEDGDIDVDGEGPMPQYPRGKLRLQLSDGQTVLEAFEYRRINELKLTTPSGFKVCHIQHFHETDLIDFRQMQLKNVRIQRGMAFLEPTTVTLKGGQTEELVKNQEFNFVNGLRHRMGQVYFLRLFMPNYNRTVGYLRTSHLNHSQWQIHHNLHNKP
jgi:RecQ-mediated genome instability protein 1